jgi:CRP-like cAMP-binding protein
MRQQARADELARIPLFARCSRRQLRQLAAEAHVEQIEPGQQLVSAGSPARQVYVIVAGTAAVERGGREVDQVGAGDVVGELGMLLDEPRNADVIATSALEVISLDRTALQVALDAVPGLGWTLLSAVAERLVRAERRA